jgi:hypothetical protein
MGGCEIATVGRGDGLDIGVEYGEVGSCVCDSETIRTVGVKIAEGKRSESRARVKILENIFVLNFTTIEPSRSLSRMQLIRICTPSRL